MPPKRPNLLMGRLLPNTLVFLGMCVLVTGLVVSFNDWNVNAIASNNASQAVASANHKAKANPNSYKDHSSSNVPSTTKPVTSSLTEYKVAPNLPRYLIIPRLGVDARVLSVGVNAQGALETPNNVYDTAWYNRSTLPGQPGAMLIDGHVSSWTANGVFYALKTLHPGDTIRIQRGDDVTFSYEVVTTRVYDVNNVDMSAALKPINPNRPGLNLISCSGSVVQGTNEFNERIVVFAEQN